jgi:hypothetical protein
MEEQILTEAEMKANRERLKEQMRAEGRLINPFEKEPQKTRKEFHGFQ